MFVVFDFDGVVFDSHQAISLAVAEVHKYLGLNPPTLEEVNAWAGPSISDTAFRLQTEMAFDDGVRLGVEKLYFDTVVEQSPLVTRTFPGVDELLDGLAVAGVPFAVATMKSKAEMAAMSSPIPALRHFEVVAAPNTFTDPVTKTELVRRAVEELATAGKAEGQGYMVGDRPSDITAGHANGLVTVAALWGYGTPEALKAEHPHFFARSPQHLGEILGRGFDRSAGIPAQSAER